MKTERVLTHLALACAILVAHPGASRAESAKRSGTNARPSPDTHYVSPTGRHIYPFASWTDAAMDIQSAADAAAAGDTVLVGDGVYDTGVSVWSQWGVRVAVSGPITIRSVSGPRHTVIRGDKNGATRCVFLQCGAELDGFTLTDGGGNLDPMAWIAHVRGGGVFCTPDSIVRNCVIVSNAAGLGGGAYGGTLVNCVVADNESLIGGGTCDSTVLSCSIARNRAWYLGGGTLGGTAWNSIVYFNTSGEGWNYA